MGEMNAGDEASSSQLTLKTKYIFTLAAYFGYFAFGLMDNINGPTLLDIAELTSSSFQEISFGVVTQTAAYSIGSLFFGWLYERINRQLGFAATLAASGCASAAIPFLRKGTHYLLVQVLFGALIGGVDVAANAWILEIWGHECNPFMQALHFCYAIGMVIIPIVTRPFLSSDVTVLPPCDMSYLVMNITLPANLTTTHLASRIVIPYAFTGIIAIAAAILLVALFLKMPYVHSKEIGSSVIGRSLSVVSNSYQMIEDPRKRYHTTVVVLGCCLFCFYMGGMETTSFTFLPQFVVFTDLKLSKSTGALMFSLMAIAYCISRLLAIYVATKVKPAFMLYFNMLLLAFANIILLFNAHENETMIWLAVVIMGMGFGSTMPAIFSFLGERIDVTNTLCGTFMFFARLALIASTIAVGSLIETHALVFVYLNMLCVTLCCLMFAALFANDLYYESQNPGNVRSVSFNCLAEEP